MVPAHLPDSVVEGVRTRDPDALGDCYEAFADPLYRYLYARCGDRGLAEDLVEATFLELVEAAPSLKGGPSAVRAWLFRAGRNNLIDAARKTRRRGDLPLDDRKVATWPAFGPGPEASALAGERDSMVHRALRQLSPDQREVLLLRFMGELSGPEVAELTGRTVGAVKALQHRGLRALQRLLARHPDLDPRLDDSYVGDGYAG